MKLLILHAADSWTPSASWREYDLVVDLGRAPSATYEDWSRWAGREVIGLHDFVEESEDPYRTRALLQLGEGPLTDHGGIDWWSVLSPEVVPHLQQITLVHRLANSIKNRCDIYSTRPDYRSTTLHRLLGGRLGNLETLGTAVMRRLRHYSGAVSSLDSSELFQILQDKFDSGHAIRRRFTRRGPSSNRSRILLPSAYINASRTALSYAVSLPDEQFLLVCVRANARVRELPANVRMISLDSYFSPPNSAEISSMLAVWTTLKARLPGTAPEYESATAVGLLDRIPSLIRWGITVRDAWKRLYESENIRSCFCADHNNAYTRIPLLLAKHARIPAIVCHHGALDASMALTTHDADFYVAKSAMERDYMTRVCGIAPEKVLAVKPPRPESVPRPSHSEEEAGHDSQGLGSQKQPHLVFFSEPYSVWSWRMDEVYRELLPHLCSLAETCGLKVAFKLHPFESAKGYRKLLRRLLSAEKAAQIEVITGPTSEQLWQNTRFAVTVQSSIAVESAARGIPVFLCGWLRDPFSGYIQQYQKFSIGHLLESADQIGDIPHLLEVQSAGLHAKCKPPNPFAADTLREVLAPSLHAQLQPKAVSSHAANTRN
jgi:hypothetical protein